MHRPQKYFHEIEDDSIAERKILKKVLKSMMSLIIVVMDGVNKLLLKFLNYYQSLGTTLRKSKRMLLEIIHWHHLRRKRKSWSSKRHERSLLKISIWLLLLLNASKVKVCELIEVYLREELIQFLYISSSTQLLDVCFWVKHHFLLLFNFLGSLVFNLSNL